MRTRAAHCGRGTVGDVYECVYGGVCVRAHSDEAPVRSLTGLVVVVYQVSSMKKNKSFLNQFLRSSGITDATMDWYRDYVIVRTPRSISIWAFQKKYFDKIKTMYEQSRAGSTLPVYGVLALSSASERWLLNALDNKLVVVIRKRTQFFVHDNFSSLDNGF